ncbi:HNH endonuclease family protein [Streptomyces sp. NPDC001933]|uniref:HNH endonuclease family protein n=1 Tax=Streptomyces sp. NPDC001933 TaxID=3364626 RepID=UPI0036C134DF
MANEDDVPGYSRAKFPHWITQYGTCDTREVTLQRDGQDVVQDDQCRAESGTWYSAYDGLTIDSASRIDIDHIVPLKEAWRSGASEWSTPERRAFANDLIHSQLIAVSYSSNRKKGDKDPGNWKPPLQSYWCTYTHLPLLDSPDSQAAIVRALCKLLLAELDDPQLPARHATRDGRPVGGTAGSEPAPCGRRPGRPGPVGPHDHRPRRAHHDGRCRSTGRKRLRVRVRPVAERVLRPLVEG